MKALLPFSFALALAVAMISTPSAFAEPWLGTRFAQNCSACHSPGRLNRPMMDRRCTLTCQACHVNPNGGGIRSFYGQWNEERWLRSIYIPGYMLNKRTPAPFRQQMYSKNDVNQFGPSAPSAKPEPRVPPLAVLAEALPRNEKAYDRYADGQENKIASSDGEFLSHVPGDDPYRLARTRIFNGGADLRYMTVEPLGETGTQSTEFTNQFYSWLMEVQVGAQVRPIPDHLSLVVESEFLNPPNNRLWDQAFETQNQVRSAYALVDDLPFNSYAMYGLYRPMFGLYNPDHDSLSNVISGLNQYSVFKAVGFGSAPNVPFFNFNYIMPMNTPTYEQSTGIAANLGAHWVTLGASLVFSYWHLTVPDQGGDKLANNLLAVTGGIALNRFIWDIEMMYRSREFAPGESDAGVVFTSQMKYRVWRENYLEFNTAWADVAMDLKAGASNEYIVGYRTFLAAGTDFEILLNYRNNKTATSLQEATGIQGMVHLYF